MCQPISRWNIFLAIYGGLAAALIISILIGIGIPMLFFGILTSTYLVLFSLLLLMACVLSVIFSLIAFTIAIKFESKVKGFSIAILVWLFFAVVYDGLVLLIMLMFKDYPLDKFTIGVVVMNPIDLARILMIMKLDASAMMGYTGAVLTKFLGKGWGSVLITLSLLTWIIVPLFYLRRLENRKDF
jgi:Cu-processing system permease protein